MNIQPPPPPPPPINALVTPLAAISTKGKMLRLQNSLTGKALRMIKDLGHIINAYERENRGKVWRRNATSNIQYDNSSWMVKIETNLALLEYYSEPKFIVNRSSATITTWLYPGSRAWKSPY